jgi:pyrimidine operon attenuation protein / uracil phosphoribosyltransferase
MAMSDKKYILNRDVAQKKLQRMAYEILENNTGEAGLIFAGIPENGYVIAEIMQQMLASIGGPPTELISISFDKRKPGDITLSKQLNFDDRVIIIIDDVVSSGKTLLYALKPFLAFQPRKIQTLVLVERSYKSFPVRPDYVGLSIATTLQEHIFVEVDGTHVTGAYMQ